MRGKVKGSQPVPHSTLLRRARAKQAVLESTCTCPTHTDGWERICHHAVALALTLRKQYQAGAEITMTQNPWVQDLGSGSSACMAATFMPHGVLAITKSWHTALFFVALSI